MPRVLVDTNLLLRIADPGASQHLSATNAIACLITAGHEVCICPQNMIEFWAVATRPSSANGFGWSVLQTCQEVAVMAVHFVMLSDTPDIYDMWKNIVSACDITGKRVHDARLAAVSEVHQCDAVLTFNIADFISIPQIKLLDPAQIGSWPLAFTV